MLSLEQKKAKFHKNLRRWFQIHQRYYPWRKTTDPYKILVSEFLLQKTNADLALSIYRDFIKEYPTSNHLAKAKNSRLKKQISPIGNSYRAERLKRMAKQLVNEYNGKVPDNRQDLLRLYGAGLYISNAVLCFAYKHRVAIVDTNTIRIFSRIFDISSSNKRPRSDKILEKTMEGFLPIKGVDKFNYALLDFGAMVCVANNPKCTICPLRSICSYYDKNNKKIVFL